MSFQEQIRRLRGEMTQTEFANVVGVSKQTIYLWETGGALPASKHARRLFDLGVDRAVFVDALVARSAQRESA